MSVRIYTSTAKVRNSGKNPSIRNRNVYVAVAHSPDQCIADIRQSRQYWHLGVADARYSGPRSAYGRLLAEAERLFGLLAAREAGTATAEQLAELASHGQPQQGWPRSSGARNAASA
jgi:hypothetical protein